jgi:hypothetical protein
MLIYFLIYLYTRQIQDHLTADGQPDREWMCERMSESGSQSDLV